MPIPPEELIVRDDNGAAIWIMCPGCEGAEGWVGDDDEWCECDECRGEGGRAP